MVFIAHFDLDDKTGAIFNIQVVSPFTCKCDKGVNAANAATFGLQPLFFGAYVILETAGVLPF